MMKSKYQVFYPSPWEEDEVCAQRVRREQARWYLFGKWVRRWLKQP